MVSAIDEQLGRLFQVELTKRGVKQATIARVLEKNPSQISRLVHGRDQWTLEIATRVDNYLGTDLASMLLAQPEPYELYVAAPITGLAKGELADAHHEVGLVVTVLRRQLPRVYWAGENIRSEDDLKDADLATEENMATLATAQAFLYLQFREVEGPSSALIELGVALGRRTHTTIVMQRDLRRPFMLRENFEGTAGRIPQFPNPRFRAVHSVAQAVTLLERDGRQLLGLPARQAATNGDMLPLI
jgi:plasmid maintenance system antidote protein VapI